MQPRKVWMMSLDIISERNDTESLRRILMSRLLKVFA